MFFAAFAIAFLILWGIVYAALPTLGRALQFVASGVIRISQRYRNGQRFVTYASRFRDYLPVAVILVAGLALTAWVGDGFVDLAELVHARNGFLQQLDTRVHDWAISQRSSGGTLFFLTMSTLGGPVGMAVIATLAGIVLAIQRRWRWLIYLAVTAGGGALIDFELKRYFVRARPDVAEMLRRAQGYSFPSGHAMGSTIVLGALAYLAMRASARWRWKAAALAFAATMVVSIAASRVYLGVHWISDVGAGITAGMVWVTVTTVAYETFRRVRELRQSILSEGGGRAGAKDRPRRSD
jgi:membrane-associated phospholipid phosphatase